MKMNHIGSSKAPNGGNIVCEIPSKGYPDSRKLWDKNAEFIVKAANHHFELIEILKDVLVDCGNLLSVLDGEKLERARTLLTKLEHLD